MFLFLQLKLYLKKYFKKIYNIIVTRFIIMWSISFIFINFIFINLSFINNILSILICIITKKTFFYI